MIKLSKRIISMLMVVVLCTNTFAAAVSDNDGSAFITKAEFDSLKNDFQAQIDSYNTSIDVKIDEAIAAYLAGIVVSQKRDLTNQSLLNKTAGYMKGSTYVRFGQTLANIGDFTAISSAVSGTGGSVERGNQQLHCGISGNSSTVTGKPSVSKMLSNTWTYGAGRTYSYYTSNAKNYLYDYYTSIWPVDIFSFIINFTISSRESKTGTSYKYRGSVSGGTYTVDGYMSDGAQIRGQSYTYSQPSKPSDGDTVKVNTISTSASMTYNIYYINGGWYSTAVTGSWSVTGTFVHNAYVKNVSRKYITLDGGTATISKTFNMPLEDDIQTTHFNTSRTSRSWSADVSMTSLYSQAYESYLPVKAYNIAKIPVYCTSMAANEDMYIYSGAPLVKSPGSGKITMKLYVDRACKVYIKDTPFGVGFPNDKDCKFVEDYSSAGTKEVVLNNVDTNKLYYIKIKCPTNTVVATRTTEIIWTNAKD